MPFYDILLPFYTLLTDNGQPILCGMAGAFTAEMLPLLDEMKDFNVDTDIRRHFSRSLLIAPFGGLFVFLISTSKGAPIWQFLVGMTAINFLNAYINLTSKKIIERG